VSFDISTTWAGICSASGIEMGKQYKDNGVRV
jgi:hypothetical protein